MKPEMEILWDPKKTCRHGSTTGVTIGTIARCGGCREVVALCHDQRDGPYWRAATSEERTRGQVAASCNWILYGQPGA
jgi:hypothetical protein